MQQGGQTRATCCAQQCCNVLRLNVAIVWPELANAGPKMLGYVVLRCCYRLAWALKQSGIIKFSLKQCRQASIISGAFPQKLTYVYIVLIN